MLKRVIIFLRKRVTILVDFGHRLKVIRLVAPKWVLLVTALIMIFFLGESGRSIVRCTGNGIASCKLSRLERENQVVLEEYAELEEDADSLAELLALMEQHDIQLRTYKNIEILPEDARQLGVGGPAVETPEITLLREIGSPHYQKVAEIERSVDWLLSKALYQQESFAEIEEKLTNEEYMLDHTPSITPTEGHLSSGFGYRIDPFLHCIKMHTGVDISNEPGTPILASADGIVSFIGYLSGYGLTVKIDHGNEIQTLYGHLSEFYVHEGQSVLRGDVIGTMGNTGRSTGPHLHYEVRVAGRPVNPKGYFLDEEIPGK
jgi:murein DD-endopeptidase MepM/ murein hydrolase activator NlpD